MSTAASAAETAPTCAPSKTAVLLRQLHAGPVAVDCKHQAFGRVCLPGSDHPLCPNATALDATAASRLGCAHCHQLSLVVTNIQISFMLSL